MKNAFRLHLWAFVLVNLALNAANWFTGGDWWAFWPFMVWAVALGAHYLAYKSRRVDEHWVEERTEDVHSKSYDVSHIDSIAKRYGENTKTPDR